MRLLLKIALLFVALSAIIVVPILAEPDVVEAVDGVLHLEQGKNYVIFSESLYVTELIATYPQVESVTYYDSFLGQQLGYVNALGGVGKNFLIVPGTIYEISAYEGFSIVFSE